VVFNVSLTLFRNEYSVEMLIWQRFFAVQLKDRPTRRIRIFSSLTYWLSKQG